MIENRDIHRFPNQGEPPRDPFVGLARAWITAGVIVGKDKPLAAMTSGVGDDLLDRQVSASGIAVMTGDVKAERVIVDVRHP